VPSAIRARRPGRIAADVKEWLSARPATDGNLRAVSIRNDASTAWSGAKFHMRDAALPPAGAMASSQVFHDIEIRKGIYKWVRMGRGSSAEEALFRS
jgi:hypothetical protein